MQDEISEMVLDAINSAEQRPPAWIRRWVPGLLETGVEWAVNSMQEKGEKVDEWIKAELVPVLQEHRDTVGHIIMRLQRGED